MILQEQFLLETFLESPEKICSLCLTSPTHSDNGQICAIVKGAQTCSRLHIFS